VLQLHRSAQGRGCHCCRLPAAVSAQERRGVPVPRLWSSRTMPSHKPMFLSTSAGICIPAAERSSRRASSHQSLHLPLAFPRGCCAGAVENTTPGSGKDHQPGAAMQLADPEAAWGSEGPTEDRYGCCAGHRSVALSCATGCFSAAGNAGIPAGTSAKGKHLLGACKGPAVVRAGKGDQDCWVCVRLQMPRKLKGRAGVTSSIWVFESLP